MDNIREQLKEKIFSKFQKDSWEIKSLGEITTEIISGSGVTKEQLNTGDYPAIRFDQIFNSEISIEECASFVNPDLIKNKKYAEPGDIAIATTSNIKKNLGRCCSYLGKDKCLVGNDLKVIKHNQNPKYLSYFLSSPSARKQFLDLSQDSTVCHLYTKEIKQIKVPLPPLEIQKQIVEFLDKFLKLERELERRKKQYEYYKNLVFNRGIVELKWEMRSIEEFANDIYKGNDVHKVQIGTGNYPAITAANINGKGRISIEKALYYINPDLIQRKKYCDYGDILITNIGDKKTVGNAVAYLSKDNCIVGENAYVIKHNQNSKFLSYALSTEFSRKQIENSVYAGIVFVLSLKDIKRIKIPLPPLDEQLRIVENLDKLYRIVHDFKEGIPFLIQKNRERYEFYRELLLEK